MRSLALYTHATLRGSHYSKGHNSISALLSTNTKGLCPHRLPFLQPADISFTNQTRILKEKKVNIIKDLLYKWGWSFNKLVFKYLKSKNRHKDNKKKKKVGDLLVALLKDKEI